MQHNPADDPNITVGTEAMSEQARPRPITARMVEEGRMCKRCEAIVAQALALGVLQREIAEGAGMSEASVSRMIAGERGWNPKVVYAADELGRIAYEFLSARPKCDRVEKCRMIARLLRVDLSVIKGACHRDRKCA